MNIPRTPITLEQAVVDCHTCGERLAVIESLGDTYQAVYVWKPNDDDPPTACHKDGISAWEAESRYLKNECHGYRQTVIDSRHVPDPPKWQPLEPEPVLAPFDDDQLTIGAT